MSRQLLREQLEKLSSLDDCNNLYEVGYWDEDEENPFDWQAFYIGPEDTPYEGGNFKVRIKFEEGYPQKGPKAYFFTKIYHCNIRGSDGLVCLTLIRDWNEKSKIEDLLEGISHLFFMQFPDDAWDHGLEYKENQNLFEQKAKEWVEKYAGADDYDDPEKQKL